MCWKAQWAAYEIAAFRNYGQRTTSPTEVTHRHLKGFLMTSTGHLLHLHNAINLMLDEKTRTYIERLAEMDMKNRRQYMNKPWLGYMSLHLTVPALELISKQGIYAEIAFNAEKEGDPSAEKRLRPCSHNFTQQYGLPCSHKIKQLMDTNTAMQRSDAHPR